MGIALRACALAFALISISTAALAEEWSFLSPADDSADSSSIIPMQWEETDVAAQSRWTLWAGAIFLNRSNPDDQPLIHDGSTTLLNARNMDFGTQAGYDLNALRHGDYFDVDFRYFQVDGMSAHHRLFPPGEVQLGFANDFPVDCPQLDSYYNSSIQSFEVNLRRNVLPRVALLAGFRYVSFDDDLSHKFDIIGDAYSLYDVHVDGLNHLYGAQIGADAVVFSYGRFQLESAVKAGVFCNDARNALRVSVFELPTTSVGSRAQQTAFVGDWNFSGIVQLTEHWALRGGYQLLWLSGVALSPEQYPVSFPDPIPGLDVITNGDVFLHGALVSIQANW